MSFTDYREKVYSQEKRLIDPYFGRWYRYFSLRLSWFICKNNITITPNQITFGQIILGLLACWVIVLSDTMVGFLCGIILLHFSYLMDCMDGEIARYHNKSSVEGVFLDKYAHAILMQAIFISVGIFFAKNVAHLPLQFLIITTSWFASFSSFMPAHRLVLTVADALLLKGHQSQYNADSYKWTGSDQEDISPQSNINLDSKLNYHLNSLRNVLGASSGNKSWVVSAVKELFRHSTYLLILSVMSLLLFIPESAIFSLFIWVFLCLGVIAKEILVIKYVMTGNVIQARYLQYTQTLNNNKKD